MCLSYHDCFTNQASVTRPHVIPIGLDVPLSLVRATILGDTVIDVGAGEEDDSFVHDVKVFRVDEGVNRILPMFLVLHLLEHWE